MMLPRRTIALSLILVASLTPSFAGNVVLDWTEQAIDATRLARNPPPMAALFLATYHAAIFDTVNSFGCKYHGWLVNDPAPAGADRDAAIASAAYTVLNALWIATNP